MSFFRFGTQTFFLAALVLVMSACTGDKQGQEAAKPPIQHESLQNSEQPVASTAGNEAKVNAPEKKKVRQDSLTVVAEPESIAVLVNKQHKLPEEYQPTDLVYPDVPFLFKEKIEKRMMRKEAAEALEELFAAAKEDGIYLAGVSAYRSHKTQLALFQRYVDKDGYEKARMYSAVPGTSEHETGLAIDVSGSTGKCAAANCFEDTEEAKWLDQHVHEYGFIIRYPKDQESITGYQYEPWHLRYVGKEIASELQEKNITLEQYFDAVPVAN